MFTCEDTVTTRNQRCSLQYSTLNDSSVSLKYDVSSMRFVFTFIPTYFDMCSSVYIENTNIVYMWLWAFDRNR